MSKGVLVNDGGKKERARQRTVPPPESTMLQKVASRPRTGIIIPVPRARRQAPRAKKLCSYTCSCSIEPAGLASGGMVEYRTEARLPSTPENFSA
jgi:hypothetical protein